MEAHSFWAVHASYTLGLKDLSLFCSYLGSFLEGGQSRGNEWVLCVHVYSVLKSRGSTSGFGGGSAFSPDMQSWHCDKSEVSTFLPSSTFKGYLLGISTLWGLCLTLLLWIVQQSIHWAHNRNLINIWWFKKFCSINIDWIFSVPGTVLDTGNIKMNPSHFCSLSVGFYSSQRMINN